MGLLEGQKDPEKSQKQNSHFANLTEPIQFIDYKYIRNFYNMDMDRTYFNRFGFDRSEKAPNLSDVERHILERLWEDSYSSDEISFRHYVRYASFPTNSYLEDVARSDHLMYPPFPIIIIERGHLVYLRIIESNLQSIPDYIDGLVYLRHFELISNHFLTTSSCSLTKLNHLRTLTLYCNKFAHFPSEIFSLNNLKYLHIEEKHIREFPDPMNSDSTLVKLTVKSPNIHHIPLYSYPNLQYFNSDCPIACFDFIAQSRLLVLVLRSKLVLSDIRNLSVVSNLRKFVMGCPNWDISNIFQYFRKLKSLSLDIGYYRELKFLPDLQFCSELQKLHILARFNPQLLSRKILKLKILDIGHCNLERLPSWIFRAKVFFVGNPLKTLSDLPVPFSVDIYIQLFKSYKMLNLCHHGAKLLQKCLVRDFPIDHDYEVYEVGEKSLRYRCSNGLKFCDEMYLGTTRADYIIHENLRKSDEVLRYLATDAPDLSSLYEFYAHSPENLIDQLMSGEVLSSLQLQRLAHEVSNDQRLLLEATLPTDHILFKDANWNIIISISNEDHIKL